jgi:hypothetical protein
MVSSRALASSSARARQSTSVGLVVSSIIVAAAMTLLKFPEENF